jgi:mRNA-degrading endonuclease RelE of RelBE toxin-antitoxin system
LKPKYNVVLSRQAENFFKKLDGKVKAKVRECLIILEEDVYAGKRLHGDLKENYSLRVGKKLRIIYAVSEKDKTVYVVAIGPRRTVYQ